MSTSDPPFRHGDLSYATAVIAVAISMIGVAALLYSLLDILLILFLGIVVAAALQPGHLWLAGWGVPKGLAVLLIYRGRMAPSGARPSTGPEKRSAPRAGQRLDGAVASRWRPPARSLRGRDRRS